MHPYSFSYPAGSERRGVWTYIHTLTPTCIHTRLILAIRRQIDRRNLPQISRYKNSRKKLIYVGRTVAAVIEVLAHAPRSPVEDRFRAGGAPRSAVVHE
jgi:hypothetical protein